MFAVGDKVVHNEHGICRITGISKRQFPGQDEKDYYEMVPLADDGYGTTFYTAVDHGGRLRCPMTQEQILEMIDSMPGIEPMTVTSTGNRMLDMENIKNSYNALMRSGDPRDWVLLLRTIYRKGKQLSARKKRISVFESHARDNSERLLYGEIAGVMEIPVRSVEKFITNRIESGAAVSR